ncbi:MAG: CatB-related O-acetyltransferase [Myxococcota bacterium]
MVHPRQPFERSRRRAALLTHGTWATNPELIHRSATVRFSVLEGPVTLGEHSRVEHVRINGPLELGRYSALNGPNTDAYALREPIRIGGFCSIARGVSMQAYGHHLDRCSTSFIRHHVFGEDWETDTNPGDGIELGHDVWVGAQAVILPGARIGHGAVIGANSVVNDVVPPYGIAVGSPARVVRLRFEEALVEQLLTLRWWDWDIERIRRNRELYVGKLTREKLDAVVP